MAIISHSGKKRFAIVALRVENGADKITKTSKNAKYQLARCHKYSEGGTRQSTMQRLAIHCSENCRIRTILLAWHFSFWEPRADREKTRLNDYQHTTLLGQNDIIWAAIYIF